MATTTELAATAAVEAIDFALDHIEDHFERHDFLSEWRLGSWVYIQRNWPTFPDAVRGDR